MLCSDPLLDIMLPHQLDCLIYQLFRDFIAYCLTCIHAKHPNQGLSTEKQSKDLLQFKEFLLSQINEMAFEGFNMHKNS